MTSRFEMREGGVDYAGQVCSWLDPDTAKLTEVLKLPSGGDTSYAGIGRVPRLEELEVI